MSFYDDYKPIRNKIRQYDPISILGLLISKLNALYETPTNKWGGYLPWELLLLSKWVIANYESVNTAAVNRSAKQADWRVVNGLINSLKKLFEKHRADALVAKEIDDEQKLQKFFRQTAFQQFWLQPSSGLSTSAQARPYYLFCSKFRKSEALSSVEAYFQARTGISIDVFFEIGLIVWTKYHTTKNKDLFITKKWFENCEHTFTDNEIDKYFELLSFGIYEAKEYANNDLKKKNGRGYLAFQILEQTPFTFRPFLKFGDRYYLYSPALLDYVVKYFVYDFLKLHEGSGFSEVFGKDIFENYLAKGLEYSGVEFKDERTQPKKRKKVDFLIENEDKALLIEAKAVEMASIATAKADNESIVTALEANVLKGIKQAYSVASALESKKSVYALIVTYKELYLGRTGSIWNEFVEGATKEFFEVNQINPACIASNRIYVISVDDFDALMLAIKNGHDVFEILDHVSEQDKDHSNARFIFGDHLNVFLPKGGVILPHLEGVIDELYDGVISRLTPVE